MVNKPLAARGVFTCQDLGHYLLENYEIAVLPGATFGDDPHALSLRLSTSFLDMETDEQAQSITTGFYDDPDADRFIHNQHPRLREVASRLADFVTELEEDFKP